MPQLSEKTLVIFIGVGLGIIALGYLWLVVRAFKTGTWWGIATIALGPLGGLVFFLAHYVRAAAPLVVMLFGGVVIGGTLVYNELTPAPKTIDTRIVDGEKHTTLTGATESELAASLGTQRESAVLQLANRSDLTDELLLEHVSGMPNLRELDLNDTPITDKGLEVLATLPKLETLRIARTKATPEGVQKHVLSLKGLKQVDVGGLNIPSKVLRDWKSTDPQNRKYVN